MQLGVFSPILRLHSGHNPFNTREPWRFEPDFEGVMTTFLRLRHQLLPYLATMNVRAHEGEPIVQPMYYDHPESPEAYDVPHQFMFGTELLVAPITSPRDPSTGLARVTAWLPEGTWIDVFTGVRYAGNRMLHLHRDLESIPVPSGSHAVTRPRPVDRSIGEVIGATSSSVPNMNWCGTS